MTIEKIGNATLYFGDSADLLPLLPQVDALITDPPYGINKHSQKRTVGGHGGRKAYEQLSNWDAMRPDKKLFDMMIAAARVHCIWGGNYFADLLPATGKWFVWDKGQRINQSDGELAWTSMQGALRIFTLNRAALRTDGAVHPTQKPVKLIKWCIEQLKVKGTVIDPYMGSGTTGVACAQLGINFIGIEREPQYFNSACERIAAAQNIEDLL